MDKNFDDMQNMTNANTGAAMRSFNAVTKSTQAIAIEIADYSKRSFEHSAKAMENFLGVKSLICKGGLRRLCRTRNQAGRTLRQSGQGSLRAVRRLCR
jgi:phasin protein